MRTYLTADAELEYSTSALPGGSLFASTYDRAFMQLADRGSASNIIGARWADLTGAAFANPEIPHLRTAQDGSGASHVVRLDDIPAIAQAASRQKLQNPDFLLFDHDSDQGILWAADAKFSVDTAKSKQVSAEVTTALLGMGATLTDHLPALDAGINIRDGVFLCPDYPLTHRLLRERRGPRRTTVSLDEVRLIPVTPHEFLEPLGLNGLQSFLASLDDFPFAPSQGLMLALYYFRLARAAVGCWQDQTTPLLAFHDHIAIDDKTLELEARRLATIRTSAWGLLQRWNAEAEHIREQRSAVDRAASLPINGKQLRDDTVAAATRAGVIPPSGTKVRRALGSWFRQQMRNEFGPIMPPVEDVDAMITRVRAYSRNLTPAVHSMARQIIAEMVAAAPPQDGATD